MKIDPAPHLEAPWRVHTLAPDFQLLDVWELPITGAPEDRFDRFFDLIAAQGVESESPIARALFWIREKLGEIFRWDKVTERRAIPGCAETTLIDRLTAEDRARSSIVPGTPSGIEIGNVCFVYRFEEEALVEVSNATIHAMLHLSWARDASGRARMAIYIKTRGIMSRWYMAAIEPFRQWFVYPAWTKTMIRAWAG
jgi:hypothetical protein